MAKLCVLRIAVPCHIWRSEDSFVEMIVKGRICATSPRSHSLSTQFPKHRPLGSLKTRPIGVQNPPNPSTKEAGPGRSL